MIRITIWLAVAAFAGTSVARAADGDVSPENVDFFDKHGYFSPDFKSAVHAVVSSKDELTEAQAKEKKLADALPELQRKSTEGEAETVALRGELAKYDHPEENDFTALQAIMNDPNAKPADQVTLAQAYVWTYPTSPHEADAQEFLRQVQKAIADRKETEKQTVAERTAAHAKLIQRAQAHDLGLGEWRDLLRDMSQNDLVKLIGQPTTENGGYWLYQGPYCIGAHGKTGLQINFNGGRVISVDELPSKP